MADEPITTTDGSEKDEPGTFDSFTGTTSWGDQFELRDGLPFIKNPHALDFSPAEPEDIPAIKEALELKFGIRKVRIDESGRFMLLITPEPSPLEEAVSGVRDHVGEHLKRTFNKVDRDVLRKRAHAIGMITAAGAYLTPAVSKPEPGATRPVTVPLSPEDALEQLIADFKDEEDVRTIANLAIQEAQNPQRVYLNAYRMLEADGTGARVLAQRRGGADRATIEADLRADYAKFTYLGGSEYETEFQRGEMELAKICEAANALADALERKEDLERRRGSKALKAKVMSYVPFRAESKWDAAMRSKGIFRLARLRLEEGIDEEAIRTELERKLAGEKDPEAVVAYVLSRISDAGFNAEQAAQTAKENAYDRAARTHVDAGKTDGQIEAVLLATVQRSDISNAEARDIVRAAIKLARAEKTWEGQKETAWDLTKGAAKVAAVGTGALTLATAATAVIGTAFGLSKLWGGVKKAAPYAWPITKTTGIGVAKGVVGALKFARNALIYAPATMLWTPAMRTYQGLRAAKNFPEPPHYHIKNKWWKKPGQWMVNGFKGAWWRTKQAAALTAALLVAPTGGLVEGGAKAVAHHIIGTEWNGSNTVDHFMDHHKEPKAPKVSGPEATAAAKPAAAAGGDHGAHGAH